MNRYLDVAPEVQEALKAGKPVVALESTIISHGMPYPQNVETALNVEKIIRDGGAVPATIAIIGGRLKAGLTPEEIDYLGKTGAGVTKASRRDLPILGIGHTVGDDGALQRHNGLAGLQSLLHLRGHVQIMVHNLYLLMSCNSIYAFLLMPVVSKI